MTNGLLEIQGGEKKIAEMTPDKRLGNPEDIAGTVVYLCSRASSHVNGTCVTIDGGSVWGRSKM